VDEYDYTPLMKACIKGNMEIAKFLISHGADKDRTNNSAYSSLMFAIDYNYIEIAKFFNRC